VRKNHSHYLAIPSAHGLVTVFLEIDWSAVELRLKIATWTWTLSTFHFRASLLPIL
jgi:hypothetical protein